MSRNDPDVTITKIYFPDDQQIQVHQSRIQRCPQSFPVGFYWYGNRKSKSGRPPKHVLHHLAALEANVNDSQVPRQQRLHQRIIRYHRQRVETITMNLLQQTEDLRLLIQDKKLFKSNKLHVPTT